jgi:hypothetical protein
LWVKKWDADFIREQLGLPGCRALLRLDKEVRHPKKLPSFETRYFVSRLDPSAVSASEFQDYIQRHWEVENCLHLQKDRYFEEDKHPLRHGGDRWTVLTGIALSLTRLLYRGERTLREVAERCLLNPVTAAERLGFKKT